MSGTLDKISLTVHCIIAVILLVGVISNIFNFIELFRNMREGKELMNKINANVSKNSENNAKIAEFYSAASSAMQVGKR